VFLERPSGAAFAGALRNLLLVATAKAEESENCSGPTMRPRFLAPAALGAWFAYLVLDFLTQAVILASWWRAAEAFALPPLEMLRRIPFGYGSAAVYCGALVWLLFRLYGERVQVATGLRFGAGAGLVVGLASAFGVYSVFLVPSSYLLVGPGSSVLLSMAVGGVATWILGGGRPWVRVGAVASASLLLLIASVVAQNLPHRSLVSETAASSDQSGCRR
jgi:hypothetical protein